MLNDKCVQRKITIFKLRFRLSSGKLLADDDEANVVAMQTQTVIQHSVQKILTCTDIMKCACV